MPPDDAVALRGVAHRYGKAQALRDVALTIPSGTATAFVGPDGVGKSTLLGLIAGVRRLQTGTIRTLDGDIASAAHRDRIAARIAYMPQGLGRNLYPSLSVRENIEFFGRLFGQSTAERTARIDRLLRATGLHPFPDRPAAKLSGGMKQKLSLCCSLIHDPDLLILDEPTTGIDPLSRRQFWALIEEIRAERPGMTVLVATAYMEEAERFERLVAIDAGRVLAAGSTAEILARAQAHSLEDAYMALQGRPPSRTLGMPPRATSSGMPAITAQGLTRRFGGFTAVDQVSFSIEQGEIFGFLGSNGCGKTTTMKMLTGLLGISDGEARLLGRPVEAADITTRMRVGYMSQSFSLYEELTVRANLELHARLYRIPAGDTSRRVDEALAQFDLTPLSGALPAKLPLGMRQRLQLAAACLHRPEVLILDEPTSGVDPAARDRFWQLLGELSRRDGVTIFVSTHFMNEAERCDRISLMHAGRVLALGRPDEIRASKQASTLEQAFIAYLEEADGDQCTLSSAKAATGTAASPVPTHPHADNGGLNTSFARVWAFARREAMELARDKVRLAFALASPLILMLTFGYGITFDVENLAFAVFDRDQSAQSRQLIESFAGSRYFLRWPDLHSDAELDGALRGGSLRLGISIPPRFGRDLLQGRKPEIGFILDGANAFRAETTRSYVQGIVLSYVQDMARRSTVPISTQLPFELEPRFRYNQDFRSVFAITPGIMMILMAFIPAMLTALGVVREREVGSISNLEASPASVGEFLLGKQMPYVVLGFASFLSLLALVGLLFGVTVKGSLPALLLGALVYVFATTGLGILISTFVRSQSAAIIATSIITTMPAINFSGYLYPVAGLEGSGRYIGMGFPSLWFQNICLGSLTKARDFTVFYPEYLVLLAFGVAYLVTATRLLRKQGP